MTVKSKRTITSMLVSTILLIAYIAFALKKYSSGQESLKTWAITILIFIGITVVAQIIIQILYHIVFAIGIAVKERECNEKNIDRTISSSMVEDEMDKLISLKSTNISFIFAGIGFLAYLVLLAFGGPAVLALHILFGSFLTGVIAAGGVSVYFYERGIQNG